MSERMIIIYYQRLTQAGEGAERARQQSESSFGSAPLYLVLPKEQIWLLDSPSVRPRQCEQGEMELILMWGVRRKGGKGERKIEKERNTWEGKVCTRKSRV